MQRAGKREKDSINSNLTNSLAKVKTKETRYEKMAIRENVSAFAVKQAISYLDKDPEKNLPRLLDWFDRFDRKDTLKSQRDLVRSVVTDPGNNWHKLVISLWEDIDPGVRNRFFENFIINGCLLGYQKQVDGHRCLWVITTISPGMRICCAPARFWIIRED